MSRRAVLGGATAAGALAGLAGCGQKGAADRGETGGAEAAPDGTDLADWEGVRAAFALRPGLVNLAAFLVAPHPRPVRQAIERHRRGLDADPEGYLHGSQAALEEAVLSAAGRGLGVPPEQIALTDSTTMGLGLLYGGLRLAPGDEVVTTEHDFYATHEALRLRAAATGAAVRRVRLYDRPQTASADGIVSAVVGAVGPRTRAVALTWVHSSTGVTLPIRRIAEALAEPNRQRAPAERVLLCVDGLHGFGVEPVTVAELGVDAFASGCHKWLFGPRGTGVLWTGPQASARLRPTIPSFDGGGYGAWLAGRAPAEVPDGAAMTPGGFHSFEHRWALAEAFAFREAVGARRVAEYTRELARQAKEELAGVPGVTVVTPSDEALSAGLVCADVDGRDPGELVARLRSEHRVVATVTPYATRYLRFGPSIVNTPEDVTAAVRALRTLV